MIYVIAILAVILAISIVLVSISIRCLKEKIERSIDRTDNLTMVLREVEQRTCVYTGSGYGTSGGGVVSLGVTIRDENYVPIRTIITKILAHLGLVVEYIPATQKTLKLKGRKPTDVTVEKI